MVGSGEEGSKEVACGSFVRFTCTKVQVGVEWPRGSTKNNKTAKKRAHPLLESAKGRAPTDLSAPRMRHPAANPSKLRINESPHSKKTASRLRDAVGCVA
jgi:hypothetical protein